jgi:hypothetical protein
VLLVVKLLMGFIGRHQAISCRTPWGVPTPPECGAVAEPQPRASAFETLSNDRADGHVGLNRRIALDFLIAKVYLNMEVFGHAANSHPGTS